MRCGAQHDYIGAIPAVLKGHVHCPICGGELSPQEKEMSKLDKDKKPVFEHDCTACEYLGRMAAFTPSPGGPQFFDVYRCPGSVLGPSYIARFGNLDFEYWSMPYDILKTVPISQMGVDSSTRLLRAMQQIANWYEAERTTPSIEDAAKEMYDYISEAIEEPDAELVVQMFRGIDHLWERWLRAVRSLENESKTDD